MRLYARICDCGAAVGGYTTQAAADKALTNHKCKTDSWPWCRRCGHACAHQPPHLLVEHPDDGLICFDQAACRQRIADTDARRAAQGGAL